MQGPLFYLTCFIEEIHLGRYRMFYLTIYSSWASGCRIEARICYWIGWARCGMSLLAIIYFPHILFFVSCFYMFASSLSWYFGYKFECYWGFKALIIELVARYLVCDCTHGCPRCFFVQGDKQFAGCSVCV